MLLGKFAAAVREKIRGNQAADEEEEVKKELELYTRDGKFYILVVESDEELSGPLSKAAEKTGCEVTVTENGISCMEKAVKDRYDVVLLTLTMARMDGLQTLHNLRSVGGSRCRDSKIYCMLETDEKRDEDALLKEGFDGVIRKPVQEAILLDIIVKNAPKKMLPDDEEFLQEIKDRAAEAEKLQKYGIFLSTGLQSCGGDMNLYREVARTFAENYGDAVDAIAANLFAGEVREYMNLSREQRESCRELGIYRLADAFDDHVNMAKEEDLEVAEIHFRRMMEEWENVTSGFCDWLGMEAPDSRIEEIFHAKNNGIRLPNKDVLERVELIVESLKENEVMQARDRITKTLDYALKETVRHKLYIARKEIDYGRPEQAVKILSAML